MRSGGCVLSACTVFFIKPELANSIKKWNNFTNKSRKKLNNFTPKSRFSASLDKLTLSLLGLYSCLATQPELRNGCPGDRPGLPVPHRPHQSLLPASGCPLGSLLLPATSCGPSSQQNPAWSMERLHMFLPRHLKIPVSPWTQPVGRSQPRTPDNLPLMV